MHRVLRPAGVSVISDLRRDASPPDIEREVKGMRLGRLDEIFTRWTFRQVLPKNAYTLEEMHAMVAQTPFEKCRIDVDGIGFLAWLEK